MDCIINNMDVLTSLLGELQDIDLSFQRLRMPVGVTENDFLPGGALDICMLFN